MYFLRRSFAEAVHGVRVPGHGPEEAHGRLPPPFARRPAVGGGRGVLPGAAAGAGQGSNYVHSHTKKHVLQE